MNSISVHGPPVGRRHLGFNAGRIEPQVRLGFQAAHVYLDSASAELAELRFRPVQIGGEWFPALPLVYDDRVPSPLMAAVVVGNDRSVISYLRPDTEYEV